MNQALSYMLKKNYYKIAVIGGDGSGPEVIRESCMMLSELQDSLPELKLEFSEFDWGSEYFLKTGRMMPEDGLEQLKSYDAILFGSAGSLEVPDHITLWGLRLEICQHFDQYANVRPSRLLPGIPSPLKNIGPAELDWVIVRENTEGEYSTVGGRMYKNTDREIAIQETIMSKKGIDRVQKFAFELAKNTKRKNIWLMIIKNQKQMNLDV